MNEIPKQEISELFNAFRSGRLPITELQRGLLGSLYMFDANNYSAHEAVAHNFDNHLEEIIYTLREENQRSAALKVVKRWRSIWPHSSKK